MMRRQAWDLGRERFSFRTRWLLVRHRYHYTWRDWFDDLRYLFRG